jgi:hypothetical protein
VAAADLRSAWRAHATWLKRSGDVSQCWPTS